ncbi:hypothetical protein [Massilibacteroides sp.]|uniref:hypothetical protein n=1 Tax=Massilibacteroides sp. TaxID=2034766 RepID=UPI00260B214D|nr:hypothetical protein [Massilibacteroides sp.]MDD4515325.1 hypothetical protein [Massilibacteroides sp.]
MKRNIYICSKPLQYFNLRNIKYENGEAEKILIIHGRFIDAKRFFEQVQVLDKDWDRIVFVDSWTKLYTFLFFHPAGNVFAEIDKSFVYGIFHLLFRFRRFYIFEEGFGSYRTDRIDESRGLKRLINRITGVGKHVGFSSFLTGQYLYLPELYKKQFPNYPKPVYTFSKPFVERMIQELPLFLQLSDGYEEFLHYQGKKIAICLTNHVLNPRLIGCLLEAKPRFDVVFIKPHPHLKDLNIFEQYNLPIVRSNIMVEFLLTLLLKNENQLTVFHENSTSVIWFQNKLESVNRGEPLEAYNIVADYIKENIQ